MQRRFRGGGHVFAVASNTNLLSAKLDGFEPDWQANINRQVRENTEERAENIGKGRTATMSASRPLSIKHIYKSRVRVSEEGVREKEELLRTAAREMGGKRGSEL
jgi:hypothetical protein